MLLVDNKRHPISKSAQREVGGGWMLRLTEILDPLVPYADNSVAAIKRASRIYSYIYISSKAESFC
jgi:hypothetical protein